MAGLKSGWGVSAETAFEAFFVACLAPGGGCLVGWRNGVMLGTRTGVLGCAVQRAKDLEVSLRAAQ